VKSIFSPYPDQVTQILQCAGPNITAPQHSTDWKRERGESEGRVGGAIRLFEAPGLKIGMLHRMLKRLSSSDSGDFYCKAKIS